jgi:hypothetical protein
MPSTQTGHCVSPGVLALPALPSGQVYELRGIAFDTGATTAQVGISLVTGPKGLDVSYTPKGGSKNTPVDIASGAGQEFEVEITPSTMFHRTSTALAFGGPATPPTCLPGPAHVDQVRPTSAWPPSPRPSPWKGEGGSLSSRRTLR